MAPRPRKDREPLSRERIARAAMELADEGGLAQVTMRALAQRLGVEAMSLYHHVAHKDDLLDELAEQILAQMEAPEDSEQDWREAMRRRVQSARHVLLRHRWASALIEARRTPGPARLKLHDAVLRTLRRAGFSPALAYHAFLTLDSYLYGFVLQETSWSFSADQSLQVIQELRPSIDPERYPDLCAIMGFVEQRSLSESPTSFDEDFARGLTLILDALERDRAQAMQAP